MRAESELKEFCQSPQFSLDGLAREIEAGCQDCTVSYRTAILGEPAPFCWHVLALFGRRSGLLRKRPKRPAPTRPARLRRVFPSAWSKSAGKSLGRTLTVSSELVPFQEIDVYAKESGFVKKLNVDYGTHVQADQVIGGARDSRAAVAIDSRTTPPSRTRPNQITLRRTRTEPRGSAAQGAAAAVRPVERRREIEARPGGAAGSGRCAGQGSGGRGAGGSGEIESASRPKASSQSAQAKREHDQALFDYSKITAPFAGVVTQRFANLGTLMQAGTSSSTQAMPLVRLSQDDLFRLVIPVPESYVRYIHIGDPVSVMVPSLNRTFPGKVARFSVDVKEDTRTMHTEVDVPNPQRVLLPGLYAEATITLEQKGQRAGRAAAGGGSERRSDHGRRGRSVQQDRNPHRCAGHPDRHRRGSAFRLAGRRTGGGQRSQQSESRPGRSSPR